MTRAAPLLMIPGLICDERTFDAQSEVFAGAIAAPGHGACASLPEMAARALVDAPPRFSLLGHSMGARVALEIWRLASERVERLALVNTGVHGVKEGEVAKRHALRDIGRAHGMAALVDEWFPPMLAPGSRADQALTARLRTMCIDQGLAPFEAQIEALLARPEVVSLLPGITCPVLVATGLQDSWAPPAQHEEIAAAVPGARLILFENAGHMLPAEAPAPFNAAIAQWLALPAHN